MRRSRIKLPAAEYRALQHKVLHRDKWKCRCCKRRDGLNVHHIKYRSHGGDDADYNLISLCNACHEGVHLPNPTTGAVLVIAPAEGSDFVDANGTVLFKFVKGWLPKRAAA